MTSQETDLFLNDLANLKRTDGMTITAEYREKPIQRAKSAT